MLTPTILNLGPIRLKPKGEWSSETAYDYLDIVHAETASYLCSKQTGAPKGTLLTDITYWQPLVKDGQDAATFKFATELDFINANESKPLNSRLIKPKLEAIDNTITVITQAIENLDKNFTSDGKVNDAAMLGGHAPSHYDCNGGCSWTCGAGCTGSCNNSCTGTCMAGCTDRCSSCAGTCAGTCSSCTGSCHGSCTVSCGSSCGGCDSRTH